MSVTQWRYGRTERVWVILAAGAGFGALVAISFVSLKATYATFVSFVIMVPSVIIITGSGKRLLLAVLIMCLPITIDVALGDTGHRGGASGYLLSVFDLVLLGLYILWFFEGVQKKHMAINFYPRISVPALVLMGIASVSIIVAPFPSLSLYELAEVAKMYLCFLYIANNLKTGKDLRFVVFLLVLGGIFEGGLGFLQHHYGSSFWPTALGGSPNIHSRIMGTWKSPNDFGFYLAFVLPVFFSFVFAEMMWFGKGISILVLLLCGGSLIWSASRGAWVSFVFAAFIVALVSIYKIKGRRNLTGVFFWVFAALILCSPLYPRLLGRLDARIGGDDRGSAESRVPQFQVAYQIIESHPLSGVGLNNYTGVMGKYDLTKEGLESITRFPVHNIFLHIAAEIGIFGLAAFLWLVMQILIEGMRVVSSREGWIVNLGIGMMGGIIAFLIHGLVDTVSLGNKLMMFVWFFAGVIFAMRNMKTSGARSGQLQAYIGR